MAGVDIQNLFPNSRMAQAVKLGQSRFVSNDTFGMQIRVPGQLNVSIAAAQALAVPATTGDAIPVTYAVVTAIGGTLYATYDGSVPSAVNYDIAIPAGSSLPVQGTKALAAIKVFGTTMSVSYWS